MRILRSFATMYLANAQTGNMLLLGVSISERNWPEVVRYLFPVLAFAAGIMLADLVRFSDG